MDGVLHRLPEFDYGWAKAADASLTLLGIYLSYSRHGDITLKVACLRAQPHRRSLYKAHSWPPTNLPGEMQTLQGHAPLGGGQPLRAGPTLGPRPLGNPGSTPAATPGIDPKPEQSQPETVKPALTAQV